MCQQDVSLHQGVSKGFAASAYLNSKIPQTPSTQIYEHSPNYSNIQLIIYCAIYLIWVSFKALGVFITHSLYKLTLFIRQLVLDY